MRKTYEWNVRTEEAEKNLGDKVVMDYRWGIMDPNRMVAVVEKTSSLYKVFTDKQGIRKILDTRDFVNKNKKKDNDQ